MFRKWKETVDEWVKVNKPGASSHLIVAVAVAAADGDSPQQNMSKNEQNGHHRVSNFGYSPNPRRECLNQILKFAVERNISEYEPKPRPPQSVPRRKTPSRRPQSVPKSASAPPILTSELNFLYIQMHITYH
ncbi:probable mediator of RNA polymerase II transcription subunit 26c [Olea europaea subsp. europaea]|uniref:Probable mediator of RNA polymerase II transcription subunit 26c n=1 Tax=Olea europaea subsp. europaea TaxID=158383 RepID=A0A8S0RUT5_OLEEU|nr:probable mediator of RNA polymerase II transcription subunit 26c [Olea europaea subsp. europaea]